MQHMILIDQKNVTYLSVTHFKKLNISFGPSVSLYEILAHQFISFHYNAITDGAAIFYFMTS